MIRCFLSFLVLTCSSALADENPNALTDAEKAAGWKLLFDGKTTAGWVALGGAPFPEKGWKAENGTLHHAAKGGGGDIITREQFDDFELVWDWKIAPGANGGLKYNLLEPTKNVGFEYQMIDDDGYPGVKGLRRNQLTGGLYDLLDPPKERTLHPPGEWNASRIVVRGNRIEHWLNGGKTAQFELGSEALKAAIAKSKFRDQPKFGEKTKSPILFQDHGDEIWLRGIKVRSF